MFGEVFSFQIIIRVWVLEYFGVIEIGVMGRNVIRRTRIFEICRLNRSRVAQAVQLPAKKHGRVSISYREVAVHLSSRWVLVIAHLRIQNLPVRDVGLVSLAQASNVTRRVTVFSTAKTVRTLDDGNHIHRSLGKGYGALLSFHRDRLAIFCRQTKKNSGVRRVVQCICVCVYQLKLTFRIQDLNTHSILFW